MKGFRSDGHADKVLLQFHQLNQLLIDASSVIYMTKAGYFNCVARKLELYSPEKTIEETGYENLHIHVVPRVRADLSPDESLVRSAARLQWPVITEDLGIIRELAKRQIPYLNSLMMLEYIFFKKLINPDEYHSYLQKLLDCAWYSSEVVEFGGSVHRVIQEQDRCL